MGEWSDYFESFPDEDPANQDDREEDGERFRIRQNYSSKFQAREQQVREAAKARKVKADTQKIVTAIGQEPH